MPVQFKFKGEKAFRSLLNVTTPCTAVRVKNAVYEQARINEQTTDLFLEDPNTGGALNPKVLLQEDVLVQVVVRRTPVVARGAASSLADVGSTLRADDQVAAAPDDDDLAIDRIGELHNTAGFAPSAASAGPILRFSKVLRKAPGGTEKKRSGYDFNSDEEAEEPGEPPPENYTCHRCGMTGGRPESHWLWECPTNDDPDHVRKVRSAKGIPREFLRKVGEEEAQELSAGGVTFTVPGFSGQYIYAHEASTEEKKLRLGDTVSEKVAAAFSEGARKIEESLKCPLCRQMFRQAMLVPCCGATFCSDCAIDRLAHSSLDQSRCPNCKAEVMVHQLVPNEDIRSQVEEVVKAGKAQAIAAEKTQPKRDRGSAVGVDEGLRDRVNRPRRHAEDPAGGMLALTDNAVADPTPGTLWHPLGFGDLMSRAHFERWQRLMRGEMPPGAKEQFEDWQWRVRHTAAPHPFDAAHGYAPTPYGGYPPPPPGWTGAAPPRDPWSVYRY